MVVNFAVEKISAQQFRSIWLKSHKQIAALQQFTLQAEATESNESAQRVIQMKNYYVHNSIALRIQYQKSLQIQMAIHLVYWMRSVCSCDAMRCVKVIYWSSCFHTSRCVWTFFNFFLFLLNDSVILINIRVWCVFMFNYRLGRNQKSSVCVCVYMSKVVNASSVQSYMGIYAVTCIKSLFMPHYF